MGTPSRDTTLNKHLPPFLKANRVPDTRGGGGGGGGGTDINSKIIFLISQ